MFRPSALLVVLAVWAAIYLPGLGTLEIKGEEGRRILPAVTMMQTGNYIVPQVGSEPYFRKPPLVNWLVAASFKIFGARNEWAARLPSALCILAAAIAFVTVARRSLGTNGSVIGALVWMTNFGMIEKGRLIEIEALYASLCGLAIVCWLSCWQERRSNWITWTVPWVFLGLGLLAKGPLLLVFFYAVVLAVLYRTGELRSLASAAHLFGLLLMLAIFAAWAVPCLLMMRESNIAHGWTREFSGRLSGEDFHLSGWLLNIPRGLGYFLPWVLLLPLVRRATFETERSGHLAKSLMWGIVLSFLGVSLLPGALARYIMPLLAPAAWLMAMLLTAKSVNLPRWLILPRPGSWPAALRLPGLVAIVVGLAILFYVGLAMPLLKKREKIRTIAAQINAALPPTVPLFAVDPDYQPFLFYVRDPIIYVSHLKEVPATARYLLAQPEREHLVNSSAQWQRRVVRPVLRLKDYRNKEIILFEIADGT